MSKPMTFPNKYLKGHPLSDALKEIITDFKQKGLTYEKVAKTLNESNYRMNSGRLITTVDVSQFMCSAGHRVYAKYMKPKGQRRMSKATPKQAAHTTTVQSIMDVMSSNIAEGLKEKLIMMIARGES